MKKKEIKKYHGLYLSIILLFILLSVGIVAILATQGVFTSAEVFEKFIRDSGIFSPLIFIILETISVIILIIPCSMGYAVGSAIFGAFWGSILNCISSFLGSFIIFLVIRKWGMPFLESFVSKKSVNKYLNLLQNEKRFEKIFAITLLLPFTPDNILCYIAGCTSISLKRYCVIILLFKLWKIFIFCYGVNFFLGFLGIQM